MSSLREKLKDKKRIVVKIGSSSLQHSETGDLDYIRLEKLVRELCDIRNQGKEVVLVTSGAIAVGKKAVNLKEIQASTQAEAMAVKQACSAVGQARLMMTYQKLFAEYNQVAAQILMTKNTVVDNLNRYNAHNTFSELLRMGVIPIVNENDTVATYEIEIGDNDTLSAIVAALIQADLLILLSDIDGLFTDDPRKNPEARFIEQVDVLTDELMGMGKASTGSRTPPSTRASYKNGRARRACLRACSSSVRGSPPSSVTSDSSAQVKPQAAIRAPVRPHCRASTRASYSSRVVKPLPGKSSR